MDFKKYNIKTPKQLFNFLCKNMKYGFTYRNNIFTEDNPNFDLEFDKYYKIRLGEDFVNSGYGVCWDFCELERQFFNLAKINHVCYFFEAFKSREEGGPTHTFALFEQKNKWFWFEYSWGIYRGIWEYNSREEALRDIYKKYSDFYQNKLNIDIYKFDEVNKRLNSFEFVEHCHNGEMIKL